MTEFENYYSAGGDSLYKTNLNYAISCYFAGNENIKSNKLKGKIVDTIEQGYFLGEKVIRYAKVVIGA